MYTGSMNQSSPESSGLNLPPPVSGEQLPPMTAQPEKGIQTSEAITSRPESAAGRAQPTAQPAAAMPMPMPAVPSVAQPQTAASSTTQSAASALIEDKDLIEKEWVDRAKAIVERNRDDPYRQAKELTVVKAEYVQKHYNKTIKLN